MSKRRTRAEKLLFNGFLDLRSLSTRLVETAPNEAELHVDSPGIRAPLFSTALWTSLIPMPMKFLPM
jgi:hypothetical protein